MRKNKYIRAFEQLSDENQQLVKQITLELLYFEKKKKDKSDGKPEQQSPPDTI